jgi:DNA-binding LacI/PurR family transcriptional regulator
MKRAKRPTLADVAHHARVSTVTVSRVIHKTGPVSQDLRERIDSSIAALGYASRKTAQPPAAGTIAVLTGDLLNPFFPEIIRGIQEEADNYGLILTLYNLTDHFNRRQQLLQRLSRQHVDGVILMGSAPFPELLTWREQHQVPLVVLNRRLGQPGIHCILVDFENAIYRATQHLLGFKHTRIGYLVPSRNSEVAQARWRGFESALTEAGLSIHPEWCPSIPPGLDIDGGLQAMRLLLELPSADRPTGVIAFNDAVALGALHAVRIHGLCVPRDISIIGVDDIFVAAHAYPPLTTIGQPKYQMGKLAVQTLARMNEGPMNATSGCTVLESPLIVRESTGPAPLASSQSER